MVIFTAKQPWEAKTYEFDFTEDLDLIDEDIGSVYEVEVVDLDDGETDLSSTMYDAANSSFSGRKVYPRIQGGTDGQRYKITVRVISDVTSQQCELEAILPVREV